MIIRLGRNLRLGYGVAIIILLTSGIIFYITLQKILATNKLIDHSGEVIEKFEKTLSVMKDAETGQRGYLLTGKSNYLDPYNGAYQEALRLSDELSHLTVDNPTQQHNIIKIQKILRQRLTILQQVVTKKQQRKKVIIADLDKGKSAMDALRQEIANAEKYERQLQKSRVAQLNSYTALVPYFILFATIAAIAASFYFYRKVLGDYLEKEQLRYELQVNQENTQALNKKLIAANDHITRTNKELEKTNETLELQLDEGSKALVKSNNQLIMAARAARIGTWFIEPSTKELGYNDVLADIFGYEDEVPMTYDQAIAQVLPEFKNYLVDEIERAIKGGHFYDVTYQQRRFNDDKIIWLHSTGKISASEDNKQITFSGIVQDITSQRLEEQRKDAFIGMVSHELKTPITSLSGFVQILTKHATKADDSFSILLLDKTKRQIGKMTKMVNDFLNVARLEAANIHLTKELFNIGEIINDAKQESQLLFVNNKFSIDINEDVQLNADKDKIGQVIHNLISNAVKYSTKGSGIELTSKVDKSWVTVSVKDQGPGIQPNDITHLFKRYYRVENEDTKSISGFGIGLYLCKEIIELHGGEIGVNSQVGVGSTFWFTLPCQL